MSEATWLVSRRFDLLAFGAPAAFALALVPFAEALAPADATPLWAWLVLVLAIDVAHVWSTIFRTYLDRSALRSRPGLYTAAPVVAYVVGVGLASISFGAFWRGMAYLAVFHFVRQQYGWVRLYGRKDPALRSGDRWLDGAAIYIATGFPVLWWHAHLPRRFDWFVPGDFVAGVPAGLVDVLWPVYGGVLGLFLLRQAQRGLQDGFVPWGKLLVVVSTALCWGVGIIATNSDWAFTVTNVIIHGVPYMAFIWVLGRRAGAGYPEGSLNRAVFARGRWLLFAGILLGLAFVEEWLWDRTLWLDHPQVFTSIEWPVPSEWVMLWMPLLAVPQVTHYILDGFIWRRGARG